MVVLLLGMWEVKTGSAAMSAAECKEERRLGIKVCTPVVYGNDPTPACCERVRVTHVEYVDRLVRLIKGCGRKVHRHFKHHHSLKDEPAGVSAVLWRREERW
ncbi:hypothetical protein AAG906_033968 [Vitis piasezkii]